jgi:hypothetical protein
VPGCAFPGNPTAPDAKIDAFIACVCAAGVCDTECAGECKGQGIGGACATCAKQAGMNACKTQYQACGGT